MAPNEILRVAIRHGLVPQIKTVGTQTWLCCPVKMKEKEKEFHHVANSVARNRMEHELIAKIIIICTFFFFYEEITRSMNVDEIVLGESRD